MAIAHAPHDRRRLRAGASAAAVLLGAGLALRPLLRGWGATKEERRRPLPGDGLIPGDGPASTMAISIPAPPSAVWPWLVQMGTERAGWYSFDHLDNGGRPSAEHLEPAWQTLAEGDRVVAVPDRSWFVVARLEPQRSLVLRGSMDLLGRPYDPAGSRPRWSSDGRWEFFLEPEDDGTRLLVRASGAGRPRWLTVPTDLVFWQPAHVIMQLRQLYKLRRLAATTAADT